MNFSIQFMNKKIQGELDVLRVGKIIMNNYSETFQSSLSYWNESDYMNQWKNGIKYIIDGHKKSCLVTSMFDPKVANYIFLWLLYLENNVVHIQNQVLFLNDLNESFNEDRIYSYISEREIIDEDGNSISEWDVKVNDFEEFLSKFYN